MSKLLIVDDALFMRHMVKAAAEELSFDEIIEAVDGRDAFEKYKEMKPDIVTLDIVMPEEDGISALTKIMEFDSSAKVIMVTAVDQKESMLKAITLGASDFVVKPFTSERIVSAIEKCLMS